MKAQWKTFAIICGLGLGMSAMAQTEQAAEAVPAGEPVPAEAVQAPEPVTPEQPMQIEEAKASKWSFDVSLYLLAPGMSGDATVKGISADVDLGFDKIWDNLHMTGMGTVRIGYGKWAFTTDVIYMDLEAEGDSDIGPLNVEFEQWMVEPTLSYRFNPKCLVLAGARYNNLSGDLIQTGALKTRTPSGTQDWWDPIVGGEVNLPFAEKFSLNLRGDVGGFGVGSDLTWQAFPYLGWQFTSWGSMQVGYRWLYMDYEDTDEQFKYDVLTQGLQIGLTASF